MLIDTYAGHHSTESAAAIHAYEMAVRALAEHRPGLGEALQMAIHMDPDFVAGHVLNGFSKIVLARPEFDTQIAANVDAAFAAAKTRDITASECALLQSLLIARDGKLLAAAQRLEDHLLIEPRDFLALKLAHALRFMGGDAKGMLRATSSVCHAYSEPIPASGFVWGCHAFALEEAGQFEDAERFGRMAVEREPSDAWGLHAVAHVFEMQNRFQEGIQWLDNARERWTHCHNFGGHVAWHLALFHIEQGDYEHALSIYDADILPNPSEDYRDIANATALLWRLGQFGVNVGSRWDALVDIAQRRVTDTKLLFASLHHLLSLLAGNKRQEAEQMLSHIIHTADEHQKDQSYVARHVAIDLARVMIGAAEKGEGIDIIRIAQSLPCLGGSHAQRDVFMRTLAVYALNTGDAGVFSQIMALRRTLKKEDRFASMLLAG